MKVLLLHQHFRMPDEGGGIRTYHLARALAAAGHAVEVITAHAGRRTERKEIDGFVVTYLPVTYANRYSTVRRLWSFARFLSRALPRSLCQPADLVYATTTPLSVPLLAWLRRRWRGTPYCVEVGDLWPDAPLQMGVIGRRWAQVFYALERLVYVGAALVVPYSPDIKSAVARKAPGARQHVTTNFADTNYFQPGPKPAALVTRYGVDNAFVVAYCGAAGRANHLEFMLAAAAAAHTALSGRVVFLVMAEGSERERLERQSGANVRWLPYGDKSAVRSVLAVADAAYVSFADVPVLATGCPNKLFDALAAGKLVVVNFGGWLRALVEAQGCGFYADPHDPTSFVRKITPFLSETTRLRDAQHRARQLAEERYALSVQLPPWLAEVRQASGL